MDKQIFIAVVRRLLPYLVGAAGGVGVSLGFLDQETLDAIVVLLGG
jgi:hypothetical protein